MDWTQIVATNGVQLSVNSSLYGAQKAGISITLGKFAEFSVGGVQYNGLTWSMLETNSGSVIITGLDEVSEAGVYYEFKNDTGETIKNPDGSFKTVSRFGAVIEVGVVSNGTTIDDAAGITVGAGGQIALGKNGIGYTQEEDINSGLITNTITIGPGAANIGLVVTRADVLDIARNSVNKDITPSIVVSNAPFLSDGPLESQFFILNAFNDTGSNFAEAAFFLVQSNTAVAFEKNGEIVFYLRNKEGEEFYYNPTTGEYTNIDTGIGYLGLNVSPAEMETILEVTQSASGQNLSIVTPSERPECFLAGTLIDMWDGTKRPIEEISVGDQVLSFDPKANGGRGNLVPRKVTETYINSVTTVLDFHGSGVTPGHVTLCADGRYAGQCVPIIDILTSDGAIVKADGTLVRAATNVIVGSEDDCFVPVAYCISKDLLDEKNWQIGQLRLGTCILKPDSTTITLRQMIEGAGMTILKNGLVRTADGHEEPVRWYGELPGPEQYVLAKSGLTLADLSDDPHGDEHASLRRRAYGEAVH